MYGLKEGEGYYPWMWPMPGNGVIGKRRVRRLDGYEKASGKAVYGRDIYRPGMLYAKYLRSRYVYARIKRSIPAKRGPRPGQRFVMMIRI
jgi:hypothetical protein